MATREWTPFGVELGAAQPGLGYTGEWFDTDVGLEYLRARWYAPYLSQFISKDPFPGLRTQPFSLHPYAYVLANPVNAVDPSGWYHSDVHYDLTRRLAFATASFYFPADVASKLADCIASGDQHVDDSRTLMAGPTGVMCMKCHFCPLMSTVAHVNKAIESGDPFLFGATLHQFQDFYAHWNEGYENGHSGDSIRAGVFPWNHIRSPGGKSSGKSKS